MATVVKIPAKTLLVGFGVGDICGGGLDPMWLYLSTKSGVFSGFDVMPGRVMSSLIVRFATDSFSVILLTEHSSSLSSRYGQVMDN